MFLLLGFKPKLLHLLSGLLYAVGQLALAVPLAPHFIHLLFQGGNLLVEQCYFLLVVFAFDGLALNLELSQPSRHVVEFLGQ